jgi:hypothetical protein
MSALCQKQTSRQTCGWKKSRAINSTLDVEMVLTTIVAKAAQLSMNRVRNSDCFFQAQQDRLLTAALRLAK